MDSLQFNRTAKALRNQFASPPITIFTREQVKEIIAIDRLREKSGIKTVPSIYRAPSPSAHSRAAISSNVTGITDTNTSTTSTQPTPTIRHGKTPSYNKSEHARGRFGGRGVRV